MTKLIILYIHNYEFEWDEYKAKVNLHKHRVSFNEAKNAFYDPSAKEAIDLLHSQGEARFYLIGKSLEENILTIVFTIRRDKNGKQKVRIISARKASKKERKTYVR